MVIQADVDDDEEVKSGKMFLVSSVTELSNSFYTGREREREQFDKKFV